MATRTSEVVQSGTWNLSTQRAARYFEGTGGYVCTSEQCGVQDPDAILQTYFFEEYTVRYPRNISTLDLLFLGMEVILSASACPDVSIDDRIRMERGVSVGVARGAGIVHGDIQVPASAGGGSRDRNNAPCNQLNTACPLPSCQAIRRGNCFRHNTKSGASCLIPLLLHTPEPHRGFGRTQLGTLSNVSPTSSASTFSAKASRAAAFSPDPCSSSSWDERRNDYPQLRLLDSSSILHTAYPGALPRASLVYFWPCPFRRA